MELLLAIVLSVLILHINIANIRTFRQKNAKIPYPGDELFYEKIKKLDSVTYEKHLWYNITFRNPDKLYND